MNDLHGAKLYYPGMDIPLAVTHLCIIVITLFLNLMVIYNNHKRNMQLETIELLASDYPWPTQLLYYCTVDGGSAE